jgi:hypothetical protein
LQAIFYSELPETPEDKARQDGYRDGYEAGKFYATMDHGLYFKGFDAGRAAAKHDRLTVVEAALNTLFGGEMERDA